MPQLLSRGRVQRTAGRNSATVLTVHKPGHSGFANGGQIDIWFIHVSASPTTYKTRLQRTPLPCCLKTTCFFRAKRFQLDVSFVWLVSLLEPQPQSNDCDPFIGVRLCLFQRSVGICLQWCFRQWCFRRDTMGCYTLRRSRKRQSQPQPME